MEWLIFVAIAAAIIGLIVWSIVDTRKRKAAMWTGVVLDKHVSETIDRGSSSRTEGNGISFSTNRGLSIGNSSQAAVNRTYSLSIKSNTGTEFTWDVGEGFYSEVSVGDTLRKDAGTLIPTVVSKKPQ